MEGKVALGCTMLPVLIGVQNLTYKCCRVEVLQTNYKEEELTRKGYVKRLVSLLDSHLMDSDREHITQLENNLKDAHITEVGLRQAWGGGGLPSM